MEVGLRVPSIFSYLRLMKMVIDNPVPLPNRKKKTAVSSKQPSNDSLSVSKTRAGYVSVDLLKAKRYVLEANHAACSLFWLACTGTEGTYYDFNDFNCKQICIYH